jgi:beta-lactamase regulating signal transducer with metallopeptidase domain
MMSELANHVWQSTLFAAVIAALAVVVRRNHARIRYRLWCAASVKFLIPFAFLTAVGSRADWAPAPETQLSTAVAAAMTQIHEPFSHEVLVPVIATPSASGADDGEGVPWPSVLFLAWALGAAAIVAMRLRLWWRVRDLVRTSVPADLAGVQVPSRVQLRASFGMLEPAVFGIFRPILLLPAGIQDYLTSRQLRAVVAHELCHVRHRDNLIASIHMLVEAVFWFHPLVWWIGGRLVDARERACDEDVLRELGDPGAYAEGILKVCRRYVEASLVCVSGISGADLRARVEAIAANRAGSRLKATTALVLITAASLTILIPVTVGAMAASQRTAALVPAVLYDAALIAPTLPDAAVLAPIAMPTWDEVEAPTPPPRGTTTAAAASPIVATPQPALPVTAAPQRLNGEDVRATAFLIQGAQAAGGFALPPPGSASPQGPNANAPARAIYNSAGTVTLGSRNFARSESAVDPALERRLDEALKSGNVADRLFITLTANYRQLNSAEYQVLVTVEAAPPLLTGGDRLRLEFVGAIQDAPYAITQARAAEAFETTLDAEARSALAVAPAVYQRGFVLLPGRYRIRFLVRDGGTDRIGVVEVPFYVPNLNRIKGTAQ